jgi:putative transposase
MLKSIKFRLYPSEEQEELLSKQFGCCRFVYNWALDYSRWEYQQNKTSTFKKNWEALLPKLKEWLPWLKQDGNSQSLQHELKHLDQAYQRFFKKQGGFPKFKSKLDKQSSHVPQNFKIENGMLSIPKIRNIPIIVSKDLSGIELRSITISRTKTGKYFASVLYETGSEAPVAAAPKKDMSVGIDLGLKDFAILSTGEKIGNPKFLEQSCKRLRRLQKSLSRKQKNSKNRTRARHEVALLHEKISNRRSDWLHHLTHRLTCESQGVSTICVENLNVRGMLRNRKLARSISSVSWGEFLRQIKYKCLWNGLNLLECGRFDPTSKTCSNCGWKNDSLRLSDRSWACAACGCAHDRDVNAARNIVDFAFALYGGSFASDVDLYSEDTEDVKPVEMEALAGSQYILPSETTVDEAGKPAVRLAGIPRL